MDSIYPSFHLSLSLSLYCSSRKNPSKKSGPSSSKKLKGGGAPGHSKGEGTVVFKSYDKSSGVSLRSSKVEREGDNKIIHILSQSAGGYLKDAFVCGYFQ